MINNCVFVIVIERWRLSSAGERFLHTEEVVGSIPTASTIYAVLAQLAEQLICNHQVVGSIPIDGTKLKIINILFTVYFFISNKLFLNSYINKWLKLRLKTHIIIERPIYAVLAQLAEQLICNHQVVGSIPIDGTI